MIGNCQLCFGITCEEMKLICMDCDLVFLENHVFVVPENLQNAIGNLFGGEGGAICVDHKTAIVFFTFVPGKRIHNREVFINGIKCGTGFFEILFLHTFVKEKQRTNENAVFITEKVC